VGPAFSFPPACETEPADQPITAGSSVCG